MHTSSIEAYLVACRLGVLLPQSELVMMMKRHLMDKARDLSNGAKTLPLCLHKLYMTSHQHPDPLHTFKLTKSEIRRFTYLTAGNGRPSRLVSVASLAPSRAIMDPSQSASFMTLPSLPGGCRLHFCRRDGCHRGVRRARMGDPCRTISEPLGGLKVTVRRPDTVRRRNSRLIAGTELGWRAIT